MDKLKQILYEMIRASKSDREQKIYYRDNKEKLIEILLELKVQLNDRKQIQHTETGVADIPNPKRYRKRTKRKSSE